jgi:hypothetical protein
MYCKMFAMTDTSSRLSPDATAVSPIPRRTTRPSWLDLRLVFGVALVLGAMLLGAVVLSSADKRDPVWALSHDVAAGTVLRASDLRSVRVQLGSAAPQYLQASDAVVGKQIQHALRAGELLPRAEIADPDVGITITLPVRPENAPPRLNGGDRITVWVSTKTCRATVILSGTAVQEVKTGSGAAFGSSGTLGVGVRLTTAEAQRVVPALDLDGAVLRVGVLSAGQKQDDPSDLGSCATASR